MFDASQRKNSKKGGYVKRSYIYKLYQICVLTWLCVLVFVELIVYLWVSHYRFDSRRRSVLVIRHARNEDSAMYECRAQGAIGPPAITTANVSVVAPTATGEDREDREYFTYVSTDTSILVRLGRV